MRDARDHPDGAKVLWRQPLKVGYQVRVGRTEPKVGNEVGGGTLADDVYIVNVNGECYLAHYDELIYDPAVPA